MAEEIERVNYYQLEYLGAEDFKAEQAYHRDMRRRHNVGHHTWGIVAGLELVEKAKPSGAGYDVFVQPGFAIDGFGREIQKKIQAEAGDAPKRQASVVLPTGDIQPGELVKYRPNSASISALGNGWACGHVAASGSCVR